MGYLPTLQVVLGTPSILRRKTEPISTNQNSAGFVTASATTFGNVDSITKIFEQVSISGSQTPRPVTGWKYSGVPLIGIKNPTEVPYSETVSLDPAVRTTEVQVTNTVTVTNVGLFIDAADVSSYVGQYDPATDLAYVRSLSSGEFVDGYDARTHDTHSDIPFGLSLLAPKNQRSESVNITVPSTPVVRSEDYNENRAIPLEPGVFKVRNVASDGSYVFNQEAIGRFWQFNTTYGKNPVTSIFKAFNDSGAAQLAPGNSTPPIALIWRPDPNEKAGSRHVELFCYYTVR